MDENKNGSHGSASRNAGEREGLAAVKRFYDLAVRYLTPLGPHATLSSLPAEQHAELHVALDALHRHRPPSPGGATYWPITVEVWHCWNCHEIQLYWAGHPDLKGRDPETGESYVKCRCGSDPGAVWSKEGHILLPIVTDPYQEDW